MTEPIEGQPAAAADLPSQDQGADNGGQPSSTPPAGNTTPQQPTGQEPSNGEPAKTPREMELERRLAGQDRLIRSLKSRGNQTPANNSGSENPDAEVESLRLFKAESQLKDAAKEILDEYPDFPKSVANAILKNPRGFIASTTQTVDDGIVDLTEYIANVWEETLASKGQEPTQPGAQPMVAAPNASVTSATKPNLDDMSIEQIDAAVASGQLTEQDLEDYVRTKSHERAKNS